MTSPWSIATSPQALFITKISGLEHYTINPAMFAHLHLTRPANPQRLYLSGENINHPSLHPVRRAEMNSAPCATWIPISVSGAHNWRCTICSRCTAAWGLDHHQAMLEETMSWKLYANRSVNSAIRWKICKWIVRRIGDNGRIGPVSRHLHMIDCHEQFYASSYLCFNHVRLTFYIAVPLCTTPFVFVFWLSYKMYLTTLFQFFFCFVSLLRFHCQSRRRRSSKAIPGSKRHNN